MKEYFDETQRVPIRSWAERIDAESFKMLKRLARSEKLAGWIAVMPDVHSAGVVSVGTVFAAPDHVFPTAIGEDMGCGMRCARYDLDASSFGRDQLEKILVSLAARVPTGRQVHRAPQHLVAELAQAELSTKTLAHDREWLGVRHIGTLGGGNHFLELERDTLGRLWATVHSGSRGVGAAIARHHGRAFAAAGKGELPALELGSSAADGFLNDLNWALDFAGANRACMLQKVDAVLSEFTGSRVEPVESFDVPHNLIRREEHGGRQLMIHRKGAMPAPAGGRGIIPGSMATASYIVEGLGNALSFASSSHGAGRCLTRTEAHARISPAQLRRQMDGIVYPRGQRFESALVEEAPDAYKPIKEVLQQQTDLVKPLLRLEPILVLKGTS